MPKVEPRSVTPLLSVIRNFLLGRKHTTALRFADFLSKRTQPPPILPDGPSHKLAANYYYERDVRREVVQPEILKASGSQLIGKEEAPIAASKKGKTPGAIYRWD